MIAEAKLTFALAKLNPGHHDIYKELLLTRAKTLEKQAEEAIKKLKAEKKDHEVSVLEKEEALIKKLVKELEEAKTSADVRHIEFELSAAERKLSFEVRNRVIYLQTKVQIVCQNKRPFILFIN